MRRREFRPGIGDDQSFGITQIIAYYHILMVKLGGLDNVNARRPGLAGEYRKGHFGVFRAVAALDFNGFTRRFSDSQLRGKTAFLQVHLPEPLDLGNRRTALLPHARQLIAGERNELLDAADCLLRQFQVVHGSR
ncbi:hypothetical protein D3C76_1449320 [compost metagenome]